MKNKNEQEFEMNRNLDRNIDFGKEAEVQQAGVAHPTVDPNQGQQANEEDDYTKLAKQLRSVRLLNDASKLLSRKESAESMIPKMKAEASAASQKSNSATQSLEKLAYAQRAKEAEDKVTKLRDSIKAIEDRAEVLANKLAG